MRKLLLASAATMGATLAMTGGAVAQPVKPVAPGTVVVHLNGYLQFEIAGYGSTDNRVGLYKLNPITTDGDARLYGGFDAQTVTGVSYGAQIELRTTTSDAGVGADKSTGTNSYTNTTSGRGSSSLYIKRAYGYLGSKDGGYIRVGQGDGAFELMQTGVVEAFGDGAQFNTDGGESSLLPADATPGNFIYADASNLYATDKIVYLSPAISGFSVGASYEPNSNGLKEGYSNNNAANSPSAALSSSPSGGDIGARRKNTVDAALQYSMKGEGVVFKASGGIMYGAPIGYDGVKPLPPSPLVSGYDDLEVYQAGAQITFAGLTLGANLKGGQVNDSYNFKPKGGREGFTYIVGASYVMGPVVLGGSFYDGQVAGANYPGAYFSAGSAGTHVKIARTLSEYGVAAGANYVISPNLSLFTQYEYGHKHQPGNGSIDVTSSTVAAAAKGDGQVQAIAAGATFKW